MADKILLEIVTPERKVVSEEVDIVVAPGELGEFGALVRHVPFLTKLKIGELRFKKDGVERYVAIMGGYAEVLPDKVTILSPAAEEASDIDVMRARAAKERAERRLREAKDRLEFARAQAALQRALARLKVAERGMGRSK
jgi:F-type H+-transporting ATPase subunit epsilon